MINKISPKRSPKRSLHTSMPRSIPLLMLDKIRLVLVSVVFTPMSMFNLFPLKVIHNKLIH